jgi:Kef-type K+ transport system membrane component KefB
MVESFFTAGLTLLVIGAALAAVLAKKFRQPSLVMYILTGLFLGPAGAALISLVPELSIDALVSETEYITLMSELGLAFLLFFIGLEIKIEDIKEVLGETLTISFTQMGLVAVAFFGLSILAGFGTVESVIIALAFMYSSTAVVVKILADKGEVETQAGKLDVSILLFEDVTVVLVMAVLSSLAAAGSFSVASIGLSALKVGFFVAVIAGAAIGSSRYLLPKFLKYASRDKHAFLIHGLAWLFLFTLISKQLGLSLEVGAFFAGVSIAQLPYSEELHEKVKPLTDFFLAVFFISLGLSLTTGDLLKYIWVAIGFSAAVIVLKMLFYYILTSWQGFDRYNSFKAAINMTQTSTFSIVYAAVALESGLLGSAVVGLITIVALLTMGISSYMIFYSDKIFKMLGGKIENKEAGDTDERKAVVAGFNEAVEPSIKYLSDEYDEVTLVDRSIKTSNEAEKFEDVEFEFSDFRNVETRKNQNIGSADLVLNMIEDMDLNREIIEETSEECITILTAEDQNQGSELTSKGADHVFVEQEAAGDKITEVIKQRGISENE